MPLLLIIIIMSIICKVKLVDRSLQTNDDDDDDVGPVSSLKRRM
jgi:hypothetical protein